MTGFRIGWAVGNRRLIEAMTNIQSHETSGPSALLQHAAVGAINGLQSSVEGLRATLENNRNVLVNELRAFDGVIIDRAGRHLLLVPGLQPLRQETRSSSPSSSSTRCRW